MQYIQRCLERVDLWQKRQIKCWKAGKEGGGERKKQVGGACEVGREGAEGEGGTKERKTEKARSFWKQEPSEKMRERRGGKGHMGSKQRKTEATETEIKTERGRVTENTIFWSYYYTFIKTGNDINVLDYTFKDVTAGSWRKFLIHRGLIVGIVWHLGWIFGIQLPLHIRFAPLGWGQK